MAKPHVRVRLDERMDVDAVMVLQTWEALCEKPILEVILNPRARWSFTESLKPWLAEAVSEVLVSEARKRVSAQAEASITRVLGDG